MTRLTLCTMIVALAAGPAAATTLTFDDAFPGLDPLLRLGAAFDPSYGDAAEVDVDSAIRFNFGNTAIANEPVVFYDQYMGQGYGTGAPSGVAIPLVSGGAAEFSFIPEPGYSVTLASFDIASYPNGATPIQGGFAIYDEDWNLLWNSLEVVVGDVRTLTPDITSDTGLYLQWGYSNDIGVDNIVFEAALSEATSVPQPAGIALLATGLLGLAGYTRCQRKPEGGELKP